MCIRDRAYIDSLYRELPEVMITGERPVVKAEQGKLVYDVPRLVSSLPVDNAYDAVKNLPGAVSYTHLDVYKRQVVVLMSVSVGFTFAFAQQNRVKSEFEIRMGG